MMSRKESVGSNSPSTFPISGIFSPSNTCNSDPGNLNSPPPAWKDNSLCFSCQQAGHWARNCPNRTPTARRELHLGPPSSLPSAGPSPVVYCPCGGGICDVKVSRKPKSSGRKFYACPLYPSVNKCNFFKWYDELSSDDLTYDAPTCECGAGPCHVYRETDGPNAGRKFFVCPIKKGQGACDFRQLVGATDSHSNDGTTTSPSIFTNCHENNSANSDFVVEGDSPKKNYFQGQGASGFSRSVDATNCHSDEGTTTSQSTLSNFHENSSANSEFVEEGHFPKQKSFQGQGACGFKRFVDATDCHSDEGTTSSQSTLTNCHENSSANSDFVEEGNFPKQKSFQGQGACGFRRFVDATDCYSDEDDTSSQSTLTNCQENSSANGVSVVGGDFACQVQEIGSSVVDCLEHAPKFGIISEPPRKDRIRLVNSEGRDDTSDEPLRNRYKRLRFGALKSDGVALKITSDGWDVPQSKPKGPTMVKALRASVLTPEPSSPQKRHFLGQISPAGSSLTGASSSSLCYNSPALPSLKVPVTWNCLESAVHQILGFQFRGWYGQLLFPPSRSLTVPSPKPFFCCISPSFDPIWDPQDVNVSNAEAAAIVPYSQSSAEPNKQSLLLEQPSKTLQGNKITEPIEETFQNAAKQIQNKLLTVLELTDFRDHKTMASDASSVFRALDGLLVDYQPFKQLVMEFVGTAASLAEAELSIQEDNTLQQVVDKYNCQKQHLENISHLHAETAAALEASTEHLESLRKEVVLVKAMLCRIEEKLLSCEAENVEILYRLEEVNEDKLKSQQRLLVAAAEVEEARKLVQKRDAAEASFKAAKLQLQQSFNES
ncbi:uncharacterized protein LOC127801430 isoform X2 [Diospyros lotus]|uniref:uncharacterized protein LOC127801430 isoform X2 n=1 Tax=Diospyros lotus TaxID=55363 RepID=UPI002253952C|nr:uncharacterized protein LOC127801430 isoform X2 [Diospyros lotus]